MMWVKLTLPPRARRRWLLITTRLSASSLAGTARTLVAVGTCSDGSMLATTRAAAPRSWPWCSAGRRAPRPGVRPAGFGGRPFGLGLGAAVARPSAALGAPVGRRGSAARPGRLGSARARPARAASAGCRSADARRPAVAGRSGLDAGVRRRRAVAGRCRRRAGSRRRSRARRRRRCPGRRGSARTCPRRATRWRRSRRVGGWCRCPSGCSVVATVAGRPQSVRRCARLSSLRGTRPRARTARMCGISRRASGDVAVHRERGADDRRDERPQQQHDRRRPVGRAGARR